jgi:hypothetical protein
MLSSAELASIVNQCWRQRRWLCGIRILTLPLRGSLARMRKSLLPRRGASPFPMASVAEMARPRFSVHVTPVFSKTRAVQASTLSRASLLDDLEKQRRHLFRGAGGVYQDRHSLARLPNVEDRHCFHRLYWAVRLARAAAVDAAADPLLVEQWNAWLALGGPWFPEAQSAYTIAERIASLNEVLFWINTNGRTEAASLNVSLKEQMWLDARSLETQVEYRLGDHNHLLNDARGLYIAGAALAECSESERFINLAFHLWETYFPRLILEDGTFAEQSSHYHLLLCRTALEYWIAVQDRRRGIPEELERRIRLMMELANDLVRPDGSMPRFGDISPDHPMEELAALPMIAHELGLLRVAPQCPAMAPATLYYVTSPRTVAAAVSLDSRLYAGGGFAFIRNRAAGLEFVAHADPRPTRHTHGDAGCGSFELVWRGETLVREPGSYWEPASPQSLFSRGGLAQNVTCLNGLAPAVTPDDQRFLPAWYTHSGNTWTVLASGSFQLRCAGFERLRPGIILHRTWGINAAGHACLDECIEGNGRTDFETRFCLGNTAWTPLGWHSQSSTYRLRYTRADRQAIEMIVDPPSGAAVSIEGCGYLEEYGHWNCGKQLRLAGRLELPLRWQTRWEASCHGN